MHVPVSSIVSGRAVVVGAAVAIFVAVSVMPAVYMLGVSLVDEGGYSLARYRQLLADPRQRVLLVTSVLLGGGTAGLATAIGAPLGLLLARADLPARRLLRLALVAPLVLPPYVLALAWISVSGPAGLVAGLTGRDLFSAWTYSLPGAILVLGVGLYPLSMLATEAAARRVDSRLEEAALVVAPRRSVFWRVTLPLVAPSVTAAALVVFGLAISEFGVPALLRVRVFTTEVFTAFAALYDFGAATALAVPLVVVTLFAGAAARVVAGDDLLTTRRSVHSGLPLRLGRWRALVVVALALVVALAVVVPVAALAFEAARAERAVARLWASGDALRNSLVLSATGATLMVALGLALGYARARAGARLRGAFDLVAVALFAVPSTVVGVGLAALWNRPGVLGEVYRSSGIIVVAYLARFTPVAALMLAASVRQIPASSEEAAAVAGAGWLRTATRILIPQISGGLAAAWVVAFILAFGELGATVLVAPPGESTLPVRIYTLIANTPASEVAALALAQASVVLVCLGLFGAIARGEGGGR